MDYVSTIFNNIVHFYNSMNPATLSGAIDVIVVEQPDGTYLSTPFHVRFGKWAVFNSEGKFVDIQINNETIDGVKMKLGENGVAFFVEEIDAEEEFPEYLATSPIPGINAESDNEKGEQTDDSRKPLPKKHRKRVSQRTSTGNKKTSRKRLVDDTPTVKQKLPFSSSIFSCRKYRSLPDLSFLSQYDDSIVQNQPQVPRTRGHQRKLTSGNIDPNTVNVDRPLPHSKSAILRVNDNDRRIPPTSPGHSKENEKVKFDTYDSDSEDEAPQKKEKPPATSRQLSDIADGALSDSEIDRQRYETHHDTEDWKWGEYPESKPKEKKMTKTKSNKENSSKTGGWSWFRWRSRAEPQEEGVYLGDLKNKDPNELEKYFGTSCTSSQTSNMDSGNGQSNGASPNSPSAMSMESLVDDSATNITPSVPEEENENAASPEEIDIALKKDKVIKKELLAGTDEHDTTPAMPETEEVKEEAEEMDSKPSSQTDLGDLPVKARSRSGTSMTSDFSSADEEVAVYTSPDDGRQVRFKRTLRLNSDQLKSLRLEYGSNDARFSITTKFQGTAWCSCHIYLLKWYEKIVISDIDGTITRSDVLGHVIPAIGGTWAHAGVAEIYTQIKNNGYRMIYLSSRAIGQSHYTKTYLQSLAQGSRMLPDGPVLLSPTSVLMAFRKEVIERKPEEFKIACLTDLRSLFPVKYPFYAGFGNRETDVKSYASVGIPNERIFIIEPSGRVEIATRFGFISTYDTMSRDNTVDSFFPPLHAAKRAQSFNEEEMDSSPDLVNPYTCSAFTSWHTHPDDLGGINDRELEDYERRRKKRLQESK
ncbi:LNS2 protein [Aphelenchoides besseyi]|nr:LNS2 protein [Aphelenchoides besseyi]